MEKEETEHLTQGENGKRLKESINQLKTSEVNSITNQKNKMETKHIILITLAVIYIAAAIVLRVNDSGKF